MFQKLVADVARGGGSAARRPRPPNPVVPNSEGPVVNFLVLGGFIVAKLRDELLSYVSPSNRVVTLLTCSN